MKVSAILPTFNRASMLRERLKELESQTYDDLEIVVIDDCSTDSTPEVIYDWKEKLKEKLIPIWLPKNSGCEGIPRAIGITHCTGDFIIHVDDDVIQHQDKVEVLVNALDNNILSFGHTYYFTPASNKTRYDNIQWHPTGWPMCDDGQVLYRKNIYKKLPFYYGNLDDGYRQLFELIKNAHKLGAKFSYIEIPVATNILHGANWSFDQNKKRLNKEDWEWFNPLLKGDWRTEIL